MALTSVYYDGPVTETDRAKNLAGSAEYGVYGPNDFKVTAHPSIPYAVLVKAGRAHGHGVTDTAAEDQVVQCASLTSGQIRWDLVAVRRNWQPALGGPSTLVVLQAGANPEIPAARKVGPGVEDDQPLFLVKWQGGTSAPVDFIDLRVWTGNGGLYAKSTSVLGYLTRVGTRINVDGTFWNCVLGSNDIAEWRDEDANSQWVTLQLGAGWINNGDSRAAVRTLNGGKLLQVRGDIRYQGNVGVTGYPVEGWVLATLPPGLSPADTTFVPGTTDSYKRGTFYYITPSGIKLGPSPAGVICQFNGLAAMK